MLRILVKLGDYICEFNFCKRRRLSDRRKEGRLAAALLKNASRDLNKELVLNVSVRNLEINLILSKLIPSETLNVIWSTGWAGARSDRETCN
jgi:hypothetical protein